MMRIIKLQKTCEASPTQWYFKTENNREGCIYYRFGKLEIYLSDVNEKISFDEDNLILWMRLKIDFLDGSLNDDQVFHALRLMGFVW